jgi:hypothetical protein
MVDGPMVSPLAFERRGLRTRTPRRARRENCAESGAVRGRAFVRRFAADHPTTILATTPPMGSRTIQRAQDAPRAARMEAQIARYRPGVTAVARLRCPLPVDLVVLGDAVTMAFMTTMSATITAAGTAIFAKEVPTLATMRVRRQEPAGWVLIAEVFTLAELPNREALQRRFGGGRYEVLGRDERNVGIIARVRFVLEGAPLPLPSLPPRHESKRPEHSHRSSVLPAKEIARGAMAAHVFRRFDEGANPVDVVRESSYDPDQVEKLHTQWARLRGRLVLEPPDVKQFARNMRHLLGGELPGEPVDTRAAFLKFTSLVEDRAAELMQTTTCKRCCRATSTTCDACAKDEKLEAQVELAHIRRMHDMDRETTKTKKKNSGGLE